MSVVTTADDKISLAKEYVQSAIECLSEVVINRCHGTDEYSGDYLGKLQRQLVALLGVRESLQ